MKTLSFTCLVVVALALAPARLTAGQSAKFRHLISIYADDKGVGLSLPEGVACGANGQVVVGDTGNDRLIRFAYRDKTVSGGSVIKIPEVLAPARIQLNSKGEIFALDSKQRRIVRLGVDGEFRDALTFDGAPPPSTIVARGFTIDPADNIYVLDIFSGRVLVLDAERKFLRVIALPDDIGFGSDLAVDDAGGLLLLDSIGRRLFSANKDAAVFASLGDLTEALATMPSYMMASKGTTFVVEGRGSSIVSFRRDASFMARQLGHGWDEGSLNQPSQMCVNDKDEVFIADRDNSRVQVFQLIR